MLVDIFWLVVDVGRWWWIYFDWWWMVVGGGIVYLTRRLYMNIFWRLLGSGPFFGWWWVVVDGGIV